MAEVSHVHARLTPFVQVVDLNSSTQNLNFNQVCLFFSVENRNRASALPAVHVGISCYRISSVFSAAARVATTQRLLSMAKTRSTPMLAGRRAIRQGLGLVTLAAAGSLAQNLPVPPLPYSYGSLVPFISEHALRVRLL